MHYKRFKLHCRNLHLPDGTGDLLALGRVCSGGLLGNTADSLLSGNWLLGVTGFVGNGCTGNRGTSDRGGGLTVGCGVKGGKLALSLSCIGVVLNVSTSTRLDWLDSRHVEHSRRRPWPAQWPGVVAGAR
jgi:hypothetical protein